MPKLGKVLKKGIQDFPAIYIWMILTVVIVLGLLIAYPAQSASGLGTDALIYAAAVSFMFMILMPFAVYSFAAAFMKNIDLLNPFQSLKRETNVGFWAAASFLLGTIIWSILSFLAGAKIFGGVFQYAVYSPYFSIFSSAAAAINNPFFSIFITDWAAPIAEETLFLFGFPLLISLLLQKMSNETGAEFLKSKVLLIALSVIIVAPLFAYFHAISFTEFNFLISAILFRAALIIFVWSDLLKDTIPKVAFSISFAIAAHIANNALFQNVVNGVVVHQGGWVPFFSAMASNPVGWLVIALYLYCVFIVAQGLFFGISKKPGRSRG